MSLIKLKATKGHYSRQFRGFYVDPEIDRLLTLASVGEGETRSEFIRNTFGKLFGAPDIESKLIKKIVVRAHDIYKYKINFEAQISISDYKELLKEDLEDKEFDSTIIEIIITKFDDKIKRSDEKKSD